MPNARTASAVASPMQAILTPPKCRASRPCSANFSQTARTALTEVKITQAYRPSTRPLIARSIWAGVRGGSTAIVGTSHGIAPYARSRALIAPACSLVRGTSTFQPYSGRFSHQPSLSRWATPAPTVSTTRPVKPSAAATKLSTVDVVVYWVSPVPSPVTATPVVPSTPAASSPSRTAARSPASTASASEPRPTAAASASKSSALTSSTSAAVRTPGSGTPA